MGTKFLGRDAPSVTLHPELLTASEQHILRFIDAGSKIRRSPLIGVQPLHESAVGPPDFVSTRSRLETEDLISLLLRHFWASTPRRGTIVNVVTPPRMPAVKIRCQ